MALILGYVDADTRNFQTFLRACRPYAEGPLAVLTSYLEVEKDRRFHQVRRANNTLDRNMERIADSNTSDKKRLGMFKDSSNVGLYTDVAQVKDDALAPWKEQLVSLKALVEAGDERLGYYLGQLAQKYEHRISRCGTLLEGASLGYQMASVSGGPSLPASEN
jgi:hypothetical protein